jgi:hypothetical protein
MAIATAMYHTGKNPLKKVLAGGQDVPVVTQGRIRRLHKAFLRYHDPENWPLLRDALKEMGREDLIGNSKKHLIPSFQPAGTGRRHDGKRQEEGEGRGETRTEGRRQGRAEHRPEAQAPVPRRGREEHPARADSRKDARQSPLNATRREETATVPAKPPRRGAGRGQPVARPEPQAPTGRRGRGQVQKPKR